MTNQPRDPRSGQFARHDQRSHLALVAALTKSKPLPPGMEVLLTGVPKRASFDSAGMAVQPRRGCNPNLNTLEDIEWQM
jgi:hypothetical protein